MVNIANAITLSRLPLLFVIVAFIYSEKPKYSSAALVIYVFAALTDWLDGFLARKLKITTSFGAYIDAVTDKIFMIGIYIALLEKEIVPHWTLFLTILILLREFLITALRAVAATRQTVISAESAGKFKTVVQMFSVFCLLAWNSLKKDFPDLLSEDDMNVLRYFGIFLYTIATVLTVTSGIKYLIKYNHVLVDL